MLSGLAEKVLIESGRYVGPGDRFEVQRPGYAVVGMQAAAPRYGVAVRGVVVTPDRRTLIVATEPDPKIAPRAITLPDPSRASLKGLKQRGEIDLGYDLTGAKATWRNGPSVVFAGAVPHLDLDVARALAVGSAGHERLSAKVAGELALEAKLELRDLLRPAVQPGSRVDAALPAERVTLRVSGSGAFSASAGAAAAQSRGGEPVDLAIGEVSDLVPAKITLRTDAQSVPRLTVATLTEEDARPRALPLRRVVAPWAVSAGDSSSAEPSPTVPPELAGGNWARGRTLFQGEAAKCSKCHALSGQGATIGPDLANLAHRDYASVLRDIREPSFAIHPDHIAQVVALRDGRVLTGVPRAEGDSLLIGDVEGQVTKVAREEVEAMQPSPLSTMPTGLLEGLGPEATRDLMTFLLTPGLEPAPIRREGAPPPRTAAEVDAARKAVANSDPKGWKPELKVLLVAGEKDHGVDEHDYPLWRERWAKLLPMAEGVQVRAVDAWPSDDDLKWADVAVWYSAHAGWSADRGPALDAFLARGGGLVYLHWAINGREAPQALADRIGLASNPVGSKFRHGPLTLDIVGDHPITAGLKGPMFEDESYWDLLGDVKRVSVLATTREVGADRPMVWTREVGKGRVVGCILGHYSWTFDDPLFRLLALRAIAWSAHEPADRLQGLSTIGTRVR